MSAPHKLLVALGIDPQDAAGLRRFSAKSGVPVDRLRYLDHSGTFPSGEDLPAILSAANLDDLQLRLLLCCFDTDIAEAIRLRAADVAQIIQEKLPERSDRKRTEL